MSILLDLLSEQHVPIHSYIAAAAFCNQTEYSKDKYEMLMKQLTGMDHSFPDVITAKLTWAYFTQHVIRREKTMTSLDVPINPTVTIKRAIEDAIRLLNTKANQWMWCTDQENGTPSVSNTIERKKKGWKQLRAAELYKEHPDITKKEFIQLLVKELDMTPNGAQTYYYNIKRGTT